MKNLRSSIGWCFLLLFGLSSAQGALSRITYELISGGGSSWTYNFSVHNDGLQTPINDFIIYFPSVTHEPKDQYDNLVVSTSPTGWNLQIWPAADPDQAPALNGFSDMSDIALGMSQTGFSITFDYKGVGKPRAQFYEIFSEYDTKLDSGMTTPVPEPSTWLAGALLGLAFIGKRWTNRVE